VLGFGAAIVCVIGWASEAVICAYGMKNNEVDNEQALQIRQIVSAIFYCFLIVPIVNGFGMFFTAITNVSFIVIAVAALFGTASYILYYKAIYQIGASKAMALNITYSAWAIVFTFIFFKESPSLAQIMYSLIVIIGSLCASIDFKNILNKASNKKTK
ncbi:MAG: EamA family transporter, partial [Anaerorhabdus sp.]